MENDEIEFRVVKLLGQVERSENNVSMHVFTDDVRALAARLAAVEARAIVLEDALQTMLDVGVYVATASGIARDRYTAAEEAARKVLKSAD